MKFETPDQLEMQLRVLGRQLGNESPDPVLLDRVQQQSRAAIVSAGTANALQSQRNNLFGLYCLLVATLPIPALFLWMDWTAVSSMFSAMLPKAASQVASGIYLWLKLASLVLFYGIGISLIVWSAVRRGARNEMMHFESGLSA